MARKLAALSAACACLALLVASTAFAGNGGIAPPDSVTDSGSSINRLYWIIFGITAVIFLLVEGALLTFIIRFRRRSGTAADADGPQLHGNTRLEVIWTIVPVCILVAIAIATFITVPSVEASGSDDDEDALTVKVEAHQFYWQYVYPDGTVALNLLRIPVDRPVRLELTSPDVAHSWWVPELTGKRDAIPGRTNVLRFEARRTGTFRGQCAEFCGIEHAAMLTQVDVLEQTEFDSWLGPESAAQRGGSSELGRQTYESVCATCHGLSGEGGIGPGIVGKVRDREGLVLLANEGQDTDAYDGYMPPVGIGWPDFQVDALLDYITNNPTLSGGAASGG
jgi:cytochrome c oxidase subunit II